MSQPPIGLNNQSFYVRERKDWAIEQESYRHTQALYSVGEPAMFILLWTVEDYENGYVNRCSRCFGNSDTANRVGAVYNQATQAKCPYCYGTTFAGGIRAKLVRPALFTDADDDEKKSARGVVRPENVTVESTNDFRWRSGDFIFRLDGSRWQVETPTRVTVRTGYDHPGQIDTSMGYAAGPAHLVDESSVAYIIPPTAAQLNDILLPSSRYPTSQNDFVVGPLIPKGVTD